MKILNPHQRYRLSEFAGDYLARTMSRRDLLRRSLLATGSVVLTASRPRLLQRHGRQLQRSRRHRRLDRYPARFREHLGA